MKLCYVAENKRFIIVSE